MVCEALVLLSLLAVPNPTLSGGSCSYTTGNPAEAQLSFCTQTRDEAACQRAASRKAAPGWIEAHPASFTPGGDCTDGGKAFAKAGKPGEAAGGAAKKRATGQASGAAR